MTLKILRYFLNSSDKGVANAAKECFNNAGDRNLMFPFDRDDNSK